MLTIHDYDLPSAKTWHLVTRGMRNSWESWEKGDSFIAHVHKYGELMTTSDGIKLPLEFSTDEFYLGPNDRALYLKLLVAGTDHGKTIRQLPIVIDMSAPNYFWVEFDTYKISTTRNSTSKMHILGKEEFRADMFSFDELDDSKVTDILHMLNDLRLEWIEAGKRKGPEAQAWRAMVQAIPDSWNYRSCWSGNYQTLRNMYHSRKNHRLREWREFCQFIETLPHADLIIL